MDSLLTQGWVRPMLSIMLNLFAWATIADSLDILVEL